MQTLDVGALLLGSGMVPFTRASGEPGGVLIAAFGRRRTSKELKLIKALCSPPAWLNLEETIKTLLKMWRPCRQLAQQLPLRWATASAQGESQCQGQTHCTARR